MLRRAAFKKPERQFKVPAPLRPLDRPVNYARISANDPALAVAKPEPYRDRALLDMACGRRCLFQGALHAGPETTVAAHSNHMEHGKARGRKADDCYSVWACATCHGWYDQGSADRYEKRRAFDAALASQRIEWERIAADPQEPMRFRKAARRALDHINQRRES